MTWESNNIFETTRMSATKHTCCVVVWLLWQNAWGGVIRDFGFCPVVHQLAGLGLIWYWVCSPASSSSKEGWFLLPTVQLERLESKSMRLSEGSLSVCLFLIQLTSVLGKMHFSGKGKWSLWGGFQWMRKNSVGGRTGHWKTAIWPFKWGTEHWVPIESWQAYSEFLASFN